MDTYLKYMPGIDCSHDAPRVKWKALQRDSQIYPAAQGRIESNRPSGITHEKMFPRSLWMFRGTVRGERINMVCRGWR